MDGEFEYFNLDFVSILSVNNTETWCGRISLKDRSYKLKLSGHTESTTFLPSNLSIRDHAEFTFSIWISYAFLGCYTQMTNPFFDKKDSTILTVDESERLIFFL